MFAVDLRGFGDSAVADDDFDSATAAEDLYQLIGRLDVGPVHLAGQDISGGAVYRLASAHPEVVLSLGGAFTADTLRQVVGGPVTEATFDGVGHYVALEAPERLASAIVDFTAGLDR